MIDDIQEATLDEEQVGEAERFYKFSFVHAAFEMPLSRFTCNFRSSERDLGFRDKFGSCWSINSNKKPWEKKREPRIK